MVPEVYTIGEIRDIIAPVAEKHEVAKIFLYGSYAKGEASADSDIDLCIDAPRLKSLLALGGLYADLEDAFQKEIDLITTDSPKFIENEVFRESIQRDGILIYECSGQ